MATFFYAVRKGRKTGIFSSWSECKEQVTGFAGAIYKKFPTRQAAEDFLNIGQEKPQTDDYFAYVDGSYHEGRYSWAFAIYHHGKCIAEKKGVGQSVSAAKMRNVAGEIEAAREAVLWAEQEKIEKLAICHDYEGVSSWAQGLWKANLPETKAYAAFMKERLFRLYFVKVKGHSGVAENEHVDKLAKAALGLR